MLKGIFVISFAIILLSSVVKSAPVDDETETEAVVTPLDVKPSEVQIVQQGPRQSRSVYYGGYGFKYAPVLPIYGYPRYYTPYYGYYRSPYFGFYG